MKAIVLAGGLGSRLRPLTFAIPKPLIPVGDRPILQHLVEKFSAQGVKDIYLAVGYRAELIQLYFGDGRQFGVNIHYSHEPRRLGTAGPLRLIRDRFGLSGPVLITNADIMTDLDFHRLHDWHVERDAAITVGIRRHEYVVPYGVIDVVDDRIQSIEERPRLSFDISCGIYVADCDTFDMIPQDMAYDMPDLIALALRTGHSVRAFEIVDRWVAIESIADLTQEVNRSATAATPTVPTVV